MVKRNTQFIVDFPCHCGLVCFCTVSATLDARHWLNPELDESQRSAVQFCIPHIHGDGENSLPPAHSRYSAPRPVSVVHGPPGTGKTTTVAEIICQYVRLKVKVMHVL